jgi:hypothetical protein
MPLDLDMTDTILDFASEYPRRRPAPASRTDGFDDDPTYGDSTIRAAIQPADAGDVQRLPSGVRIDDAIRIFSIDELRVTSQGDGAAQADEVQFEGAWYQVVNVSAWTTQGRYWDARAVRINP